MGYRIGVRYLTVSSWFENGDTQIVKNSPVGQGDGLLLDIGLPS